MMDSCYAGLNAPAGVKIPLSCCTSSQRLDLALRPPSHCKLFNIGKPADAFPFCVQEADRLPGLRPAHHRQHPPGAATPLRLQLHRAAHHHPPLHPLRVRTLLPARASLPRSACPDVDHVLHPFRNCLLLRLHEHEMSSPVSVSAGRAALLAGVAFANRGILPDLTVPSRNSYPSQQAQA